MLRVFEGQTADENWQAAAEVFRTGSGIDTQDSRGGVTVEMLHTSFSIANPSQRWVVNREPPINPAFAIAEVVWILNGLHDSAFLNFWNRQLPKYAGSTAEYHGAYGYRLRRHFGFDQLARAFEVLKQQPNSRQVVLSIWDTTVDLPDSAGQPMAPDIPCNVMSILKVRGGKLEWLQIMRSNDLYKGIPYNFVQFTSLQEIMAGWLGLEMGSYNHISDSLHLYEDGMKSVGIRLYTTPAHNSDHLALPYEQSAKVFATLEVDIRALTLEGLTQEDIMARIGATSVPKPYHNLYLVMAAEAARRAGWSVLSQDIMANCTNAALNQVWARWLTRMQA
jgi:thymidylate synthase